METLKKIITNIISLKQEGAYWDFKREWYESAHNTDYYMILFACPII